MPISYRIDSQQCVIWTTITGVLTDEDIISHKKALVQDPAFKPGMKELSDVRGVERLQVTDAGIRRFVAQDACDSSCLQGHRLAIVVSSDFVFGTARMYEALTQANPIDVMVFRDIDKTKAWLEDKATS